MIEDLAPSSTDRYAMSAGAAAAVVAVGAIVVILGVLCIYRSASIGQWNNTAGPAWMHRGQRPNTSSMITGLGIGLILFGLVIAGVAIAALAN
jgi:hypothetical protein